MTATTHSKLSPTVLAAKLEKLATKGDWENLCAQVVMAIPKDGSKDQEESDKEVLAFVDAHMAAWAPRLAAAKAWDDLVFLVRHASESITDPETAGAFCLEQFNRYAPAMAQDKSWKALTDCGFNTAVKIQNQDKAAELSERLKTYIAPITAARTWRDLQTLGDAITLLTDNPEQKQAYWFNQLGANGPAIAADKDWGALHVLIHRTAAQVPLEQRDTMLSEQIGIYGPQMAADQAWDTLYNVITGAATHYIRGSTAEKVSFVLRQAAVVCEPALAADAAAENTPLSESPNLLGRLWAYCSEHIAWEQEQRTRENLLMAFSGPPPSDLAPSNPAPSPAPERQNPPAPTAADLTGKLG